MAKQTNRRDKMIASSWQKGEDIRLHSPHSQRKRPFSRDSGIQVKRMLAMLIQLDRESYLPLYEQIKRRIRTLVESNVLPPGTLLPATRLLAKELQVNRTTVTAAYEELIAEGILEAHVGRGTFVAPRPSETPLAPALPKKSAPVLNWTGLFSKGIKGVDNTLEKELQRYRHQQGLISFAGRVPDSKLFPIDQFRQVINVVLREEGRTLLQYNPVDGYPPLKRYLVLMLLQRGIEVKEEEILIVNGSQQALDLVARVLIDPGDTVIVEGPSYPGALNIFRSLQAEIVAVPVSEDGLDRQVLTQTLQRSRPKCLYTMPTFHNPTGLTLSLEGRRELLTLSETFKFPIIEDDVDSDLRYTGTPLLPLRALGGERVVYIGTFSKILFPGLRLGWVVAPLPLMERLLLTKQLADLQTSALLQAAIYRFCQKRFLEQHMRRVIEEYGKRRSILLESLQRYMPAGIQWTEPAGGLSLLLRLPPHLDSHLLLPKAVERGVLYTPISSFYADGQGRNEIRLSFSSIEEAEIKKGIQILGKLFTEVLHGMPVEQISPHLPGALLPVV